MATLVLGATGATGQHVAAQLLDKGKEVRIIVRDAAKLPPALAAHPQRAQLRVVEASVLDMPAAEFERHVRGCSAVVQCLGHNLTRQGLWGHPRFLVRDSAKKVVDTVRAVKPETPVKFVVMGSNGIPVDGEVYPIGFRLLTPLLRLLLPPHVDNEATSEYVRSIPATDPYVQWVVVRPDTLTDDTKVTPYEWIPAMDYDPVFDSSDISRINVAHAMAQLASNEGGAFTTWRGKSPALAKMHPRKLPPVPLLKQPGFYFKAALALAITYFLFRRVRA